MSAAETKKILEEESPLALFPELLTLALKHSKSMPGNSGQIMRKIGDPTQNVLVPIDGELRAFVPTGRAGETKLLHKYARGSLAGLADIVEKPNHGSTLISGQESNVLCIQGALFKKWLQRYPDHKALLFFLNTTPAVLSFCLECLRHKVSAESTVNLLKNINHQSRILNKQSAILDLQQILFIESGTGSAKILIDNHPADEILLYPGIYIGHTLLKKQHNIKIQIFPSGPMAVHQVPISKAIECIGSQAAEMIARDTDEENDRKKRGSWGDLETQTLPKKIIHDYFNGVDLSKIATASASSEKAAALATLSNISLLLNSAFSSLNAQVELQVSQHLSLGRLAELLERQGLITRCLSTKMKKLKRQKMPLLIIFQNRPCVLVATSSKEIIILDPVVGLLTMRPQDFEIFWNRQALEVQISPIEHALEVADEKKSLHNAKDICDSFIQDLLQDKKSYANLYKLGLICIALEATLPQFFQYTLDKVLAEKNFAAMPTLAIGFAMLVIALAIGNCARTYFAELKSNSQGLLASSILLRQFMQFPSQSAGSSKAGEYSSRIFVIEGIVHYWNVVSGTLKIVSTTILVTLIILFCYSWTIGIVALLTAAGHIGVRRYFMAKRLHTLIGVSSVRQRGYDDFIEQLSNTLQIRARNAQSPIANRIEESMIEVCNIYRNAIAKGNRGTGIGELISSLGMAVSTIVLLMSTKNHEISAGVFLAFINYMLIFWLAIKKWGDIAESQTFLNFELNALIPFVRTDLQYSKLYSHKKKSMELNGKIQFQKVGYRYPNNTGFGLHDLNFTILPGQTIAIVGHNGSGKTTVGKILAGLIEHKSGTILYDDVDSRFISNFSLRDQVGYISHKPIIFEGTILNNIAFGDDSPDIKRATDAALRACALEFIEKLPGGFDFFLNGNDNTLSLGQQMLIQIARALYLNPKVLIIDDANVSIDAKVAQTFSNNLHTLMNDRTVILISHRISTLRKVDQIIVLKKGSLIEIGSHDELMKKNREYMQLFRTQVNAY